MQKILRLYNSISTRLQAAAILLSLVGFGFGLKSYLHVREQFGAEAALPFWHDLLFQLLIAIAVNIVVALLINRIVTLPLNTLNEIMRALANGNLPETIPYATAKTEIGSTARKVQQFQQNVKEKNALEKAQQDAEIAAKQARRETFLQLTSSFERDVKSAAEKVVEATGTMHSISEVVARATEKTDSEAESIAVAAAHAAAAVNNMAATLEEMSNSICQLSAQVTHSATIAQSAQGELDKTRTQVTRLSSCGNEIRDMVGMIDEITDQINLLALNATIEAARAGEAGKGFSVVAGAVKTLADQTGKATALISAKVQDMQTATGDVVSSSGQLEGVIAKMREMTTSVADAMAAQQAATQEISHNITRTSGSTQAVSKQVAEIARASSHNSQAADEMLAVIRQLKTYSGALEEAIKGFLARIEQ